MLLVERAAVLDDARRLQASRSWRYGHAAMRALGRLGRAPLSDEGAAESLVARLSTARPRQLPAVASLRPAERRASPEPARHRSPPLAAVAHVTSSFPIHNAAAVSSAASTASCATPAAAAVCCSSTMPARIRASRRCSSVTAGSRTSRVLVDERTLGFTATVNRGFDQAVADSDVVVLNSDTEVPPRWLEQLMIAAYEEREIGTVTPVSNNAGAFSVPEIDADNALPPGFAPDDVARLVAQDPALVRLRAPTGSGFCLYVKRACLDSVGRFDEEHFPRGYGEENDFCMRASALGWSHAVDDATWVLHHRESSFGEEKAALVRAQPGHPRRRSTRGTPRSCAPSWPRTSCGRCASTPASGSRGPSAAARAAAAAAVRPARRRWRRARDQR